jgi:hypothetical protein
VTSASARAERQNALQRLQELETEVARLANAVSQSDARPKSGSLAVIWASSSHNGLSLMCLSQVEAQGSALVAREAVSDEQVSCR